MTTTKYNEDQKVTVSIWLLLVGLVMIILLTSFVTKSAIESGDVNNHPTAPFVVDETNEWEMHDLELPTKGDVLNWHMSGYWGFSRYEGDEYVEKGWYELPGGSEVWDKLYGLDHENPAYIRR